MHPGPGHYKAHSRYVCPCDGQRLHRPLPRVIVSASEEPKEGVWLYCILRVLRLPQAGLFFLLHLPSAVNCLRVMRAVPFGSLPRRLDLGKNERIAQDTVKSAERLSQHPAVVNCCPVPSTPSHHLPWKPNHLSLLPPSPSWERRLSSSLGKLQ